MHILDMPRRARILLPNTPHHIMQRGHNRDAVFYRRDDFVNYKNNLLELKEKFGCKIYAYCLMTNHVHLIIDPGNTSNALSLLMKAVAGRQTRYINKTAKRSGSLWEGRFKSSIISTLEYLLSCSRYIELNPLRAGMVKAPEDYKWSSYQCKAYGKTDNILDFDCCYTALGDTEALRQKAYREYTLETIPEEELKLIRNAIQRNQLTGTKHFRNQIMEKFGIKISDRGRGRPVKGRK